MPGIYSNLSVQVQFDTFTLMRESFSNVLLAYFISLNETYCNQGLT